MALRYLLDENLRGPLWSGLMRANARADRPIEMKVVGLVEDVPLGTPDPEILRWAEREGYILITNDFASMPGRLGEHLASGGHVPGLFLVGLPCPIAELIEWLMILAHEEDEFQWRDRTTYLP